MKRFLFLLLIALSFSTFAQQRVVNGEYFWDQDPGIGKGTSFSFTTGGTSVDETIDFNTTGLSEGIHLLMFRTRSDSGYWSLTESHPIMVEGVYKPPMQELEVFWNTDNGLGSGTITKLSSSGDSDTAEFELDIPGGLTLGPHSLNVRTKASSGNWSLTQSQEMTVCTTYGPLASFYINEGGIVAECINQSRHSSSYLWDFDDGSAKDTSRNPVHIFDEVGVYDIVLTASNVCGTDTAHRRFSIGGIVEMTPDAAGQNGLISGLISGVGFVQDSARFRLVNQDGSDTIVPEGYGLLDKNTIAFSLDLSNKLAGLYNLEYLVADTVHYSKEGAFLVEGYVSPELSIKVRGPNIMRGGRFYKHKIILENKGNVDAIMVPVFFQTVNLKNSGHMNIIFEYENMVDDIDTLKKLRQEFIDEGGDSAFVHSFVTAHDSFGNHQNKILSFVVPRLKPGVTIYEVTLVIYGNDIGIETNARVGSPMLGSDARLLRQKADSANGADCLAKAVLCTVNFTNNVLDIAANFSAIADCARDFFAFVDNTVKVATGTSVTEAIVKGVTGGDDSKIDVDGLTKALNLSQKPINYTMTVASMIVSCGKLAADAVAPGSSKVLDAVASAAKKGSDFKIAAKTNTIKNIFTEDIPCFVDLLETCTGKDFGWLITSVTSRDPNAKYGPGLLTQPYINPEGNLAYTITYENVKDAAVAAQEVFIYDTLDSEVYNFETFDFTGYGWDTLTFSVLSRTFGDTVRFSDIVDIRPAHPNYVRITGTFNKVSGIAEWVFTTLDTNTLQLTDDVFDGFLPPNETSPEGEGYVSFDIQLKDGLTEGTSISNKATIIFDVNKPIITNTWENFFDLTKPESAVKALPATHSDTSVTIEWSGTDNLSGIASYDIYVNSDNGEFFPLALGLTETSMDLNLLPGVVYGFYSVAHDTAGNIEDIPTGPDATTTVVLGIDDLNSVQTVSTWLGQNIPNPSSDHTYIPYFLSDGERINLTIYDGRGSKVEGRDLSHSAIGMIQTTEVNTSGWSSGIYWYVLEVDGIPYSRKMIVD